MTPKQKYLIITPFFPNKKSYMGSYIFDQVKTISELSGYEIIIVKIVSVFSSEKDYVYNGFHVYIFKVLDLPFFILPGIFYYFNNYRILSFLRRKELVTNLKYVHAHVAYPAAYLAVTIAKRYNLISFAQHHGLDVLQLLNGRNFFIKLFNKKLLIQNTIKVLNKITINIGVSQLVLDKLHNFENYNPQNELVLYNGVDTKKFFPIKQPDKETFLIGCIANFWETKDQITLIKAIKNLRNSKGIKDIEVKFIGTGATINYCKQYVNEHDLSDFVHFLPEQDHSMLNNFYNSLDLFVLPSYFEAFGCVYLEAWATHTPFIAVKGQGIEEIIDSKSKQYCLFDQRNYNKLSERILEFYQGNVSTTFLKNNFDIQYLISKFLRDIE